MTELFLALCYSRSQLVYQKYLLLKQFGIMTGKASLDDVFHRDLQDSLCHFRDLKAKRPQVK